MEIFIAIIVGFLMGVSLGWLAIGAAYRNGVTDGYGYSKEPNCPGYRHAGEYLRKYMAHRWYELKEDTRSDNG
jgi:hypothetical protein